MKYFLILATCLISLNLFAQDAASPLPNDEDINQIENEIAKKKIKKKVYIEKNPQVRTVDYSSLVDLAPFSDIAVISKRYLPKTHRFQFSLGASVSTNDPFFTNFGGTGQLAFYFSENWGLELNSSTYTISKRDATKGLEEIGVQTDTLVSPQSYMGADLQFIPIYGKISLLNNNIVPFDFYFGLGGGTTTTNLNEKASTVRISTGQIFALTKSSAFRWDLGITSFSSLAVDGSTQQFNNLFLTLSYGFFFPGAKYR